MARAAVAVLLEVQPAVDKGKSSSQAGKSRRARRRKCRNAKMKVDEQMQVIPAAGGSPAAASVPMVAPLVAATGSTSRRSPARSAPDLAPGAQTASEDLSRFSVGAAVLLMGLVGRPELKGKCGLVTAKLQDEGRYAIELRPSGELMKVKEANLQMSIFTSPELIGRNCA